jgi:drug/metabolite transporter (DMT)-like permease
MLIFILSLLLTVVSNVLYHIFQKLTPAGVNPALALVVTYGTALVASLGLFIFYPPEGGLSAALRKVNWASVALGVAIVGLELGFLLAYRAGWNISLAGIVSASLVALVLIPVGLTFFKEKLSLLNLLGVALCIGGLALINLKS